MGDRFASIRIAAVQAAPAFLDREGSIDKACALIEEAGRHGADIVGFPENFVPGHPVWFYYHAATSTAAQRFNLELFKNAVEVPSGEIDRVAQAAMRAGVNVVLGMTERRPNTTGTLYNTQLFLGRDGTVRGHHRKLVPTVGERLVHCPGEADRQGAAIFDVGPVSGLICGENSNPLAIAALSCAYPYVHVASWPNHFIPDWCGMQETSLLASRNVAYMNKCYVISACGTNSPEMLEALPRDDADRAFLADPRTSGGSAIVDPLGTVVAGPIDGDREEILYVDTDPDLMLRGRMVHDFVGHYNRPDIFSLEVTTTARPIVRFRAPDAPDVALAPPATRLGGTGAPAIGAEPATLAGGSAGVLAAASET